MTILFYLIVFLTHREHTAVTSSAGQLLRSPFFLTLISACARFRLFTFCDRVQSVGPKSNKIQKES